MRCEDAGTMNKHRIALIIQKMHLWYEQEQSNVQQQRIVRVMCFTSTVDMYQS